MKAILRHKRIILLFASIVLIALFLVFLGYKYHAHPCSIKKTDAIVENAMAEVLTENDGTQNLLTRQETLQIISDVFYNIKQPGFEAVESYQDAISQALKLNILWGDEDGLQLDRLITKQECLVFIARGLGINGETETNTLDMAFYKDDNLISNWAKPYVDGLIRQGYLAIRDGNENLCPTDHLSVSQLKELLNGVVKKITGYKNYWEFIWYYCNHNPVIYYIVAGWGVVATTLGLVWTASDRRKNRMRKRRGVVYLAGAIGVGKTTLLSRMKNQFTPIYELKKKAIPTRAKSVEKLEFEIDEGNVSFDGYIIDAPGSKLDAAYRFLNSKHSRKTLILILAHTKAYNESQIDQDFVNEQYLNIEKGWGPVLQAYGDQLDKLVIFINKADVLSKEYYPAEEKIYERHLKILCEAADIARFKISVIEGSSKTGMGVKDVMREL